MKMRKKACILILILFILIKLDFILALGISPSKIVLDYEPFKEHEFAFTVLSSPGKEVEIFTSGELGGIAELDKKTLKGSGSFKVKFRIPNNLTRPGEHRLSVGVREKIKKGSSGTFIGARVQILAPIIIMVPYPGKYAEIGIQAHDANVGEPVKFKVTIASKGKETIVATTNIDIILNNKTIDTLKLGSEIIEGKKSKTVEGILNTSSYRPGNYEAEARVDYVEGIARAKTSFKLGHLFINITNYTKEVIKEKIQPYKIDIESRWNNPIENVYGVVKVFNGSSNITSFTTPSLSLDPWDKKTLKGYLDTSVLKIGDYQTEIKVIYGKNSTKIYGKLKVLKKPGHNLYLIIGIVGGIIAIILISLIIIIYLMKKRNREKNEKRKSKKEK